MKIKRIKYLILTISIILTWGCENILEPPMKGQTGINDLLSSEDGLITVLNGAYEPLLSIYKGTNIVFITDMAGDDGWTWRKETEPDIYNIDPNYGYLETVWELHYRGITTANSVIDNLDIPDFSSQVTRDACEGQAKFLRAFYYFNLVRLIGEVPLIVNEIIYREDAEQPRSSVEAIYSQIKNDLDDAISLLPDSYPGGSVFEHGRPTSVSAIALKSLVCLELQEWNEVVQLTGQIKDKGQLLPEYAANFNGSQENSSGSFFEVQYGGDSGGTTSNHSDALAPPDYNGLARVLPTDDRWNGQGGGLSSGDGFVQLFEEGDLRKDVIISGYDLGNFIFPSEPAGSLYYINKYYNTADPEGRSTWNYPLIRYAEILLARAEALNEIGYTADGEAFEFLNKTRVNAGLIALTSDDLPDQDAFRTAMRKERRIELGFESKRYFDLNRWGILHKVIQDQMDITGGLTFPTDKMINHPITGKKYFLFPVPAIEYANNANLTEQNPGY
jgi:starch-binding outer membrane protein, SusD/RagB family